MHFPSSASFSLPALPLFSLWNLNSLFVAQVPSPAAPQVGSAPLEPTPAEEESRKSISRSFKGTMASSTERKTPRRHSLALFPLLSLMFPIWPKSDPLHLVSPACDDVLSPAAVADSAVKVLNSCLANMPAGRTQTHKLVNVKAVYIFCSWFEVVHRMKYAVSQILKQIFKKL